MKKVTPEPLPAKVVTDTVFSLPACFVFVVFCLFLFSPSKAQNIKGYEYYKVITGRQYAENKASVGPFQVNADNAGGQIKVRVGYFQHNCAEQVTFTWSFTRALQFFPSGGDLTIRGQVGVSGNCTPDSDPFFYTSSGGSAAIGLPQNILNVLTESERAARGLTKASPGAGDRIYGKGGPYANRVGVGSDTYSFSGGGILFLKIYFHAGGSGIDQFYDGFAIYFFRPVYDTGSQNNASTLQWRECETSTFGKFCGTWTLNPGNRSGTAIWDNGVKARLTIETLTEREVVITRQDASGLRATYRGTVQGNSVSGNFSFYWTNDKTKIYKGTWNASW